MRNINCSLKHYCLLPVLKNAAEWNISNLTLVKAGPKNWCGPAFDIPTSPHACSYLLVPVLIANKPKNANSSS